MSDDVYDIRQFGTNYYFSTKDGNIYEVYFDAKKNELTDDIRLFNPRISLFEFGFDKIRNMSSCSDNKIYATIAEILFTFCDRSKICYSYVCNPTGHHRALYKLYEKWTVRMCCQYLDYRIIRWQVETLEGFSYFLVLIRKDLELDSDFLTSEVRGYLFDCFSDAGGCDVTCIL